MTLSNNIITWHCPATWHYYATWHCPPCGTPVTWHVATNILCKK